MVYILQLGTFHNRTLIGSTYIIHGTLFDGCSAFESVIIVKGITSIGIFIFCECPVCTITLDGIVAKWNTINTSIGAL